MKFNLELSYNDNRKLDISQYEVDSKFTLYKFEDITGWHRLDDPYRLNQSILRGTGLTNTWFDETVVFGGNYGINRNLVVSSVDTEARSITLHTPDGTRQMSRAELERDYPREAPEVLRRNVRTEMERREAQAFADRARLEEQRRNRPFWQRAMDRLR